MFDMCEILVEETPYSELKREFQILEQKNRDLTDNLYYAAFVQQGLMPQPRHFEQLTHPYFVHYLPLQIIGGDFYWIGKKGDWDLMAVGDCTGHGVSGAMLSTLALGFLNYLVFSKSYEGVGDVLNELDKKWIETFNRHNDDTHISNDWMEISLVAYNNLTGELQYAGAMSQALIVFPSRWEKLKGDAFPIGGWQIEKNRKFTTHYFKLEEPVKIYLFSDGLKDQFGGAFNKRLGSSRFFDSILRNANLSMTEQKERLIQTFKNWKHTNEQTDDICVMAMELNY
jgi:serine phosphatase RsbU (regulator of sigma subunit)